VARLDSLAMKANDGPASVALFERIRTTWPDVVPVAELVVRGYGRTLFLKGDRPNAVKLRLLAEALYSRSHSAANEVGRGYLFSGDTSNALVHFRRSLDISPHNSAVRRMVDKLEDSRRRTAAGGYEFEPVTMKGREKPTARSLVLTVADSAKRWVGSVRWDGKEVPLDELVVGGDHLWATVDINDQTLELKLEVSGPDVSGVWSYGWGNNGMIRGHISPVQPSPPGQTPAYSSRSATVGSSPAARRAGSQHAAAAIPTKRSPIAPNVSGSLGLTPTSIEDMTRVSASAPAAPSSIPAPESLSPCPMASWKMLPFCAPSAIRTPISEVRWRTTLESTP
jgi:hypothetical protein